MSRGAQEQRMMAMMGFEGFDSTKVCRTREDATLA